MLEQFISSEIPTQAGCTRESDIVYCIVGLRQYEQDRKSICKSTPEGKSGSRSGCQVTFTLSTLTLQHVGGRHE